MKGEFPHIEIIIFLLKQKSNKNLKPFFSFRKHYIKFFKFCILDNYNNWIYCKYLEWENHLATQGESPTWHFEQITKKFLLHHTVLANIGQLKTKLKEQKRTHFQLCDSCPLFWDNILRQIFPPKFKYCTWRNIFLACWVGKNFPQAETR